MLWFKLVALLLKPLNKSCAHGQYDDMRSNQVLITAPSYECTRFLEVHVSLGHTVVEPGMGNDVGLFSFVEQECAKHRVSRPSSFTPWSHLNSQRPCFRVRFRPRLSLL